MLESFSKFSLTLNITSVRETLIYRRDEGHLGYLIQITVDILLDFFTGPEVAMDLHNLTNIFLESTLS